MSKKKYINADVLFCFYKQVDELQHSPDKISKIKARFLKNNVIPTIQNYKVENAEEVRHGKWMIKNNKIYWQDKDSSSYELAYVIEWTGQHFEIVEAVEHVESAKPMVRSNNNG